MDDDDDKGVARAPPAHQSSDDSSEDEGQAPPKSTEGKTATSDSEEGATERQVEELILPEVDKVIKDLHQQSINYFLLFHTNNCFETPVFPIRLRNNLYNDIRLDQYDILTIIAI